MFLTKNCFHYWNFFQIYNLRDSKYIHIFDRLYVCYNDRTILDFYIHVCSDDLHCQNINLSLVLHNVMNNHFKTRRLQSKYSKHSMTIDCT